MEFLLNITQKNSNKASVAIFLPQSHLMAVSAVVYTYSVYLATISALLMSITLINRLHYSTMTAAH